MPKVYRCSSLDYKSNEGSIFPLISIDPTHEGTLPFSKY